jgi:VIT1/CCC1 family predicted Fe2+/Mn2+ transporter
MQSAPCSARPARTQYRHELRTLTYVTLDDENAGIIRNLTRDGVAVQAVGRLQPKQLVKLRFELRLPRLHVEAHGQVTWATSSGQCGIRFIDLTPRTRRQIDEWVFSNLLDSADRYASRGGSTFASVLPFAPVEDDGLVLSAPPRAAIRLEPSVCEPHHPLMHLGEENLSQTVSRDPADLNWLSRPVSARTLAWILDSLVMTAALLLFAVVFLSIAHELPQWRLTLCASVATAALVAGIYWALFTLFGGARLGVRIARTSAGSGQTSGKETADRFR